MNAICSPRNQKRHEVGLQSRRRTKENGLTMMVDSSSSSSSNKSVGEMEKWNNKENGYFFFQKAINRFPLVVCVCNIVIY